VCMSLCECECVCERESLCECVSVSVCEGVCVCVLHVLHNKNSFNLNKIMWYANSKRNSFM